MARLPPKTLMLRTVIGIADSVSQRDVANYRSGFRTTGDTYIGDNVVNANSTEGLITRPSRIASFACESLPGVILVEIVQPGGTVRLPLDQFMVLTGNFTQQGWGLNLINTSADDVLVRMALA